MCIHFQRTGIELTGKYRLIGFWRDRNGIWALLSEIPLRTNICGEWMIFDDIFETVLKTGDLLIYRTDCRFSLHRLVTDVEMTLISL